MKRKSLLLAAALASSAALFLTACAGPDTSGAAVSGSATSADGPVRVAVIPKINGIPYYEVVKKGVDEAAAELGDDVEVIWNGPSTDEASQQIQIIQNMVNAKVDVIAIAANDEAAVAPALKAAEAAGVKVMSWDGDADVRDVFVQLVDPAAFGAQLADLMGEQVGGAGDVAIITSTFTAPNQVAWIDGIEKELAAKYPDIDVVTTVESGEDQQRAMQQATDLIQSNPDLKGLFAVTTAALPGAAQAVENLGLSGKVAVVGNSTPNAIRQYFKSGTLKSAALWNPADHGYLVVETAYALAHGDVATDQAFEAGRLGEYSPEKDDAGLRITLSPPLVFTADNIDDYDF
ncbi:substrate-binding domain-containing protein [Puerhibacterium puerhi]|uniref:substrate-binding domain-containing protein n=1 Tax=Puerhibacterium puerhi TaxID=2692623 RepID=UPI00135C068F|nr:substrate-binding domain-containing protein [Puerhibacterium puerhi]